MITVVILAAIVIGFARALGAPRALVQGLVLGTGLLIVARLVVDPAARPDIATLAGWGRGLAFLGIAAVPVLGYAALVRRLRRTAAGPDATGDATASVHPQGFVLIEDDDALAAEIARRVADALGPAGSARETFSVAYREDDGHVSAAGQACVAMGMAEVGCVWVDVNRRGRGLGREIVRLLEEEARRRGAGRAMFDIRGGAAEGFCTRLGYAHHTTLEGPRGAARSIYTKDLA